MSLYDWAHYTSEKDAVKMHTSFSMQEFLPQYIYISDGKTGDNLGAFHVVPSKGSVVVADRGYCDTDLLKTWDSMGIAFVVRFKKDIYYRRLCEFEQPDDKEQNILIDEAIQFTGSETSKNYKHPIRRVVVYDTDMKEEIELLTSNAYWKAGTVAALYKARWDNEILFKTIKQLLL